jgi:hypothetical protein
VVVVVERELTGERLLFTMSNIYIVEPPTSGKVRRLGCLFWL